ncbi:MAG: Tex family protein, partial [Desulfobacterales bacterium]
MIHPHQTTIGKELGIKASQVQAVSVLFDKGATIPFIARYRKEATGNLDELEITTIRDRLKRLKELDDRRETILKSLEKHGHLTDELKEAVFSAETIAMLEDIYLPYRPKRRTKATVAMEQGLEPLAKIIFEQTGIDPYTAAVNYVDSGKNVHSAQDALTGAGHIIAEWINEDPLARDRLRQLFAKKGTIKSVVATGMESKGVKYKDYFDWEEPIIKAPSHRILAMRRGEKDDILNLTIAPPEEAAIKILEDLFLKGDGPDSKQVKLSIHDSYKRLLSRSLETEIRLVSKERADADAIKIFEDNLRKLLLAPPLGAKKVMGIDPGIRTGCKIVCLDRQGKFLYHETIYPHLTEKKAQSAAQTVKMLCQRYQIEAIAVGNGTAGRETEDFIKNIGIDDVQVVLVNESGASVYSSSAIAREEFPDLDLTIRGAISIGRRLMDPLSELVKIDPKSIGVGQYQHDVDQVSLKQALDDVVISCVNRVGVDANQASVQLLTYVSGLGLQLAKNIVAYRDENGSFRSRMDLKNVPRLGPMAFEQSAGFLRIIHGSNPLDASAVHPESYPIVNAMAHDLGFKVTHLMTDETLRKKIDISKYVTDTIGIPTLNDILDELSKPGRDPREPFSSFAFADGIKDIKDLKPGMKLPGIITNVTAFGAFADIGVHRDGLIHISELSDRYVKNPADIVTVNQKVMVTVVDIDIDRGRIS